MGSSCACRRTNRGDGVLEDLAMPHIETPYQLLQFADALRRQGGFIAAVGAMLGVAAVLRGAPPTSA